MKWVGMLVALFETPATLRHLTPGIGEHSDEVRTAAGLLPPNADGGAVRHVLHEPVG